MGPFHTLADELFHEDRAADGDATIGAAWIAVRSGMFSVHPTAAMTRFGTFHAAANRIAPIMVAAPVISCFISSIRIEGLMEMPPLSKVIPLPTKASVLAC